MGNLADDVHGAPHVGRGTNLWTFVLNHCGSVVLRGRHYVLAVVRGVIEKPQLCVLERESEGPCNTTVGECQWDTAPETNFVHEAKNEEGSAEHKLD